MGTKTKLAIGTLGLVVFVSLILGIRQKVDPINDLNSNDNTNIDEAEEGFDEFNQQVLNAITQLDSGLEDDLQEDINTNSNINSNANSNVNAVNHNTNAVPEEEISIEEQVKNKFLVDYYAGSIVVKELANLEKQKITSITLTSSDVRDDVISYYKEKLGDQIKEIDTIKDDADDKISTSLILFSSEEGEGDLNISIWTQEELTYINLSISDNFIDPREQTVTP